MLNTFWGGNDDGGGGGHGNKTGMEPPSSRLPECTPGKETETSYCFPGPGSLAISVPLSNLPGGKCSRTVRGTDQRCLEATYQSEKFEVKFVGIQFATSY